MNKVILVGNLTRDPEFTTTASGVNVCKFTLAVSRRFQNANGERETDFISVVVWRAQAETCAKYLRKGRQGGRCREHADTHLRRAGRDEALRDGGGRGRSRIPDAEE